MATRTSGTSLLSVAFVTTALICAGCSNGQEGGGATGPLPETVYGGGGGMLSIDLEVNQPARLIASFGQYDQDGENERDLDAVEEIEPGAHTRTINISPGTYLYFELGVPDATVGAKLDWVVKLDGREVHRESDNLMEPLESGYAFFIQFEADDVAQVRSWMD